MKNYPKLKKVKRIALGADAGLMRGAARALGFADAILDDQWSRVGDAGAASATLALAASLDNLVVHRFDNTGAVGLPLNHPDLG